MTDYRQSYAAVLFFLGLGLIGLPFSDQSLMPSVEVTAGMFLVGCTLCTAGVGIALKHPLIGAAVGFVLAFVWLVCVIAGLNGI